MFLIVVRWFIMGWEMLVNSCFVVNLLYGLMLGIFYFGKWGVCIIFFV